MTLIIIGHEKAKDGYADAWPKKPPKTITPRSEGLFAVADSIITGAGTNGDKPILSGIRKVHHMPIKVFKPHFVCRQFRGYLTSYFESGCLVAFSGSTLTATHAINTISEHLSKLQVTYSSEIITPTTSGYLIQRHCEYNELRDAPGLRFWDDDMFIPSDFDGLLTGDYISTVIEHSINVALKSAKKYRLCQRDIEMMRTDFVAGVYCPKTKQHEIYVYRMKERTGDSGTLEVYTEKEAVPEDQVVLLGMRDAFESRAQDTYNQALQSGKSTGAELFSLLNSAIDEVINSGSFAIDRPSLHKLFNQGNLKLIDIQPQT